MCVSLTLSHWSFLCDSCCIWTATQISVARKLWNHVNCGSPGIPSYVLAMIRLQDIWLFWPYSFSISLPIHKMDDRHLEGSRLPIIPQVLTVFFFLNFSPTRHSLLVNTPRKVGSLPRLPMQRLFIFNYPSVFDHLPPLLVIGYVLADAFLPPSYIFFGSAGNDMSTHDG